MLRSLVGSEMCIRDSANTIYKGQPVILDKSADTTKVRGWVAATTLVTATDVFDEFATLTLGSGAAAMVMGGPRAGAHRFLGGTSMAATEHHGLCVGDLSYSMETVSFDRLTGVANNCCGDQVSIGDLEKPDAMKDITHEGGYFKFPFDVQKQSYAWWDGDLGKATAAKFVRTEDLFGTETYVFEQRIDKQEVASRTVPAAIFDGTGEDAIVGSLVAFLLDRDELRFDIEAERLDRARKAVLGQSSTVLLKRSISVCFAICWRTLPRCPLARSRRPDWSAAPLVGRFSATR